MDVKKPKGTSRKRINWSKIKVTISVSKKGERNPLNPNTKLSEQERQRRLLEVSSRIWRHKTT